MLHSQVPIISTETEIDINTLADLCSSRLTSLLSTLGTANYNRKQIIIAQIITRNAQSLFDIWKHYYTIGSGLISHSHPKRAEAGKSPENRVGSDLNRVTDVKARLGNLIELVEEAQRIALKPQDNRTSPSFRGRGKLEQSVLDVQQFVLHLKPWSYEMLDGVLGLNQTGLNCFGWHARECADGVARTKALF
ncbi:hypothetical protein BJX70DRAFT_397054 [Aspergillus crustosus]